MPIKIVKLKKDIEGTPRNFRFLDHAPFVNFSLIRKEQTLLGWWSSINCK